MVILFSKCPTTIKVTSCHLPLMSPLTEHGPLILTVCSQGDPCFRSGVGTSNEDVTP